MHRTVGTDDAISQEPKRMSMPDSLAIAAPRGLPAIAVSQSPEDSDRLTIPENIKKRPSRCLSGRSGVTPAASAIDDTRGNTTPDRAVLLGNAGAITASTTTML